jgi:hypothetical protein
MSTELETDYLVVGAGAMALAFVDTILSETDAEVVIVDRYDRPGGHWRVAYDFVRLHQPSDYYGVNSMQLGSGGIDRDGFNAGLHELATRDAICDYFERVMRETFLTSGRVRYLPNSEYRGEGKISRLFSGAVQQVNARRRIVDATYSKVSVPAVTPPPFVVRDDIPVIPPGEVSRGQCGYDRYVVIGGGKTGLDTVSWLLRRGTPASRISWVMPRDAWLFNREMCQPGPQFVELGDRYGEAVTNAYLESSSIDEFYDSCVETGYLFRLSEDVRPTSNRCATVTRSELEALRTVDDVIRMGHVREVSRQGLTFASGSRQFEGDVLYINCTANGLARCEPVPVFSPGLITLQSVELCNQVYSASFIGYIESRSLDDDAKNVLTTPIPHPENEVDYIRNSLAQFHSEILWSKDAELVQWKQEARLAGQTTRVGTPLPPPGQEREKALSEARETFAALIVKSEEFLHKLDAPFGAVGAGA